MLTNCCLNTNTRALFQSIVPANEKNMMKKRAKSEVRQVRRITKHTSQRTRIFTWHFQPPHISATAVRIHIFNFWSQCKQTEFFFCACFFFLFRKQVPFELRRTEWKTYKHSHTHTHTFQMWRQKRDTLTRKMQTDRVLESTVSMLNVCSRSA